MSEEKLPQLPPDTELVTLHSAGGIPGVPGTHGVGQYLVHLGERTIKRVEDWLAELAEKPDAEPEQPATDAPQAEPPASEPAPVAKQPSQDDPAPAQDEASAPAEA